MIDHLVYIDDFVIDTSNLLGQGACGRVFSASRRNDNKQYCAKIVQGNSQNVQKELQILNFMKDKQNENIVNVFHCNYIPEKGLFVVIMERCDSDLEKEIKSRIAQQRWYTEVEVVSIMKQLFNGYKILYQSQIIHRDIKPANILIYQGKYKIADFGVGKIYSADSNLLNITKNGTPAFKAPELQQNYEFTQNDLNFQFQNQTLYANQSQSKQQVLIKIIYLKNLSQSFFDDKETKQKFIHKVDIYSFGILFYHLLTGSYPFQLSVAGIMEFIKKIKDIPFRMPQQLNISQNTCQLIERMITYSPSLRIDFQTISSMLGIKIGTIFNRDNAIVNPVRPPQVIVPSSIRIIPLSKPLQDLLQQYRNIFYEKCCENDQVVKIYRNYCDLCLAVAIYQLEERITLDLIKDFIFKYQQANKCDIEFQFEVKLDKIFYIDEYCRVLKSQFIPKIFNYEQIQSYGEQHLKFMLISQKLINGSYDHKGILGNQQYISLKDLLQRDFSLSKGQYKQLLDDLF
ncbi:unnamed protein product [Paramecium sonneborni]|uniref:Protein kinase domain-containing protein n=1 Tax=Paramecium sonneborni TaxID=65129 RepID=A0A8S1NHP7_9CILI|nr:unnamed protein product [Paramecium sonneborni]